MNQEATPAAQSHIRLERRYQAAIEDLWDLWTTKEGLESWWGPEGFRVEVYEIDPRVGGGLHYDMIADAPEQIEAMKEAGMAGSHEVRGTFVTVTRMEHLEINHVIDFIPGVEPYENRVSVDFSREGSEVRMLIMVEPHRDEEWTRNASLGWESQLRKLPAALEAWAEA